MTTDSKNNSNFRMSTTASSKKNSIGAGAARPKQTYHSSNYSETLNRAKLNPTY